MNQQMFSLSLSLNRMQKASPVEFARDNLCPDLEAPGAISFCLEDDYDVLSTATSNSEEFAGSPSSTQEVRSSLSSLVVGCCFSHCG